MLEITGIKVQYGEGEEGIRRALRPYLGREEKELISIRILRRGLDLRHKPQILEVYTLALTLSPQAESRLLKARKDTFTRYEAPVYTFPEKGAGDAGRPVVVGAGPAGLFAALALAEEGYAPMVLERGKPMAERIRDTEAFWAGGPIDPESNVQFGEGGAGTFSDGKINSGVRDRSGRIPKILGTLVELGAPEEIRYESRGHIGTDKLREIIPRLRRRIQALGGTFAFETRMDRLLIEGDQVCGLEVTGPEGSYTLKTGAVIVAPGHSARDLFRSFAAQGIAMENKAFAVGMRAVHPQALIDRDQYGTDRTELPPASYKLTYQARDGRGVYSFCMCPGGYVVHAASAPGQTVVNGMSDLARDSGYANSAVVVTVDPKGPLLCGMELQEELERRACQLAGGRIPWQRYTEYMYKNKEAEGEAEADGESEAGGRRKTEGESDASQRVAAPAPWAKGLTVPADLRSLFPEEITEDLREAMADFGRKIPGFDGPDCIFAGPESRTSSPVRILRDDAGEGRFADGTTIHGFFPCGEGAGYAGGILSASLDGLKVAEHLGEKYAPDPKWALRNRLRRTRKDLPASRREAEETAVCRLLTESKDYRRATHVFLYISVGAELGTRELIQKALADGKQVYLPRVLQDGQMVFAKIRDTEGLTAGSLSIPEPHMEAPLFDPEACTAGDRLLMLLPGIGFDRRCERLGQGKGYYDRWLNENRPRIHVPLKTLGLAFRCQLTDEVPTGPEDHPLSGILTADGFIHRS